MRRNRQISDNSNDSPNGDRPFENKEEEAGFKNFLRIMKFKHRKNFMIGQIDQRID